MWIGVWGMKILKKFKWLVLIIFIILLIILLWLTKDLFITQKGALYGNRLEGIEEVEIDKDLKKDISTFLLSVAGVKKVSTNVYGKVFNILIWVDETISLNKVKEISNEALAKCSNEQQAFYDISFFIDYAETSDKADFPLIGYKNKNSKVIVW